LPKDKVAGVSIDEVERDIRSLQSLASKIRTKRIEAGAMTSDSKMKVSFSLEDGKPLDVNAYTRSEANTVVEEVSLSHGIADDSSCS
jgi:protein SSD1